MLSHFPVDGFNFVDFAMSLLHKCPEAITKNNNIQNNDRNNSNNKNIANKNDKRVTA